MRSWHRVHEMANVSDNWEKSRKPIVLQKANLGYYMARPRVYTRITLECIDHIEDPHFPSVLSVRIDSTISFLYAYQRMQILILVDFPFRLLVLRFDLCLEHPGEKLKIRCLLPTPREDFRNSFSSCSAESKGRSIKARMARLEPYKGGYYLWKYVPSLAAAIIFIILFICTTAFHFFKLWKTRARFCIPFAIGGICMLYL